MLTCTPTLRHACVRDKCMLRKHVAGPCSAFRKGYQPKQCVWTSLTAKRQRVLAHSGEPSEFDVDAPAPEPVESDLGPRDDDVLPASLVDAISEAARATAEAIARGNSRCQVEILLSEFWDPISGPFFPNKGDQERFWKITRRFVEGLAEATAINNVKAVYPDSGVAAMLSYQWKGATFKISSLTDRHPVQAEDGLIVVPCPDPPGADECMRMVRQILEQDEQAGVEERPVVLFNPRLSSGDVGLGLNARRIRTNFLQNFVVTYSLRPIGEVGSVFRRYPGMWKVFLEEESMPGRYRLIGERPSRPQGEALDFMLQQAMQPEGANKDGDGGSNAAGGFLGQLQRTMSSLSYFMRSLSQ